MSDPDQSWRAPPARAPARRDTSLATFIGGALFLVLLVAGAIIFFSDGGPDGAAGTSPSVSPSATGDGTPVAGATASPGTTGPPSAGEFAADDVVVLAADRLTLRSEPGLDGEAMWVLPEGQPAFVIDGPQEADGLPWYQLSGLGLPYGSGCVTPELGGLLECPAWLGWVAGAGEDGTPWLAAAEPPDCPEGSLDVVSLSELQYTMRLICFDREDLTFRAWWPTEPVDSDGRSCAAAETEIAWLVCQNVNPNGLAANPDEPGGRLVVSIDPASGVTMPSRGQWIEVVGHFDDPAAEACAEAAELLDLDPGALGLLDSDPVAVVFNCRLQFVLTDVVPATAP